MRVVLRLATMLSLRAVKNGFPRPREICLELVPSQPSRLPTCYITRVAMNALEEQGINMGWKKDPRQEGYSIPEAHWDIVIQWRKIREIRVKSDGHGLRADHDQSHFHYQTPMPRNLHPHSISILDLRERILADAVKVYLDPNRPRSSKLTLINRDKSIHVCLSYSDSDYLQ